MISYPGIESPANPHYKYLTWRCGFPRRKIRPTTDRVSGPCYLDSLVFRRLPLRPPHPQLGGRRARSPGEDMLFLSWSKLQQPPLNISPVSSGTLQAPDQVNVFHIPCSSHLSGGSSMVRPDNCLPHVPDHSRPPTMVPRRRHPIRPKSAVKPLTIEFSLWARFETT
jgi:hypothetical protein